MAKCEREHPILPPEHEIDRCFHARIGSEPYSVVLCHDRRRPAQAALLYSSVPSDLKYSLVTMLDTPEHLKEFLFKGMCGQAIFASRPLYYKVHVKGDIVKGFRMENHDTVCASDETIRALEEYVSRNPDKAYMDLLTGGDTHSYARENN